MSGEVNKSKLALVFGTFVALIHAVWALFIAVLPETFQKVLNWIFELHFIKPIYTLTVFNFGKAVALVILTFISGYLFGWIFGTLWNWIKRSQSQPTG